MWDRSQRQEWKLHAPVVSCRTAPEPALDDLVKFDLVRARLIKLGVEITGLGIGISPGVL